MPKSDPETFIEFTQTYGDNARVTKRGMDATPIVARKHDLGEEEVIAFTSWLGENRAMTAFHFHESFPLKNRQDYMRKHEDGIALLDEVRNQKAIEAAGLDFLGMNRWESFRWQMQRLKGLLSRLANLLARPLRHGKTILPNLEPEALADPVEPPAPPVLAEKQRQALPESFARGSALPHWERGYEHGPLSKEELIALEQEQGEPSEPRIIH